MKRIFAIWIAFIMTMGLFNMVQVSAAELPYTGTDNRQLGTEGYFIAETGRGYIKFEKHKDGDIETYHGYYSTDKVNWTEIPDDDIYMKDMMHKANIYKDCQVIETDDWFIFRPYTPYYEWGDIRVPRSAMTDVFNKDFQYLKEYSVPWTGAAVSELSYIDGVFYVNHFIEYQSKIEFTEGWGKPTKQTSYYSTDFKNWEVYREDGGIPVQTKSGNLVLAKHGVMERNFTNLPKYQQGDVRLCSTDQGLLTPDQRVVYEPINLAGMYVVGGYCVGMPLERDNTQFGLSKDGVYFTMFDIPNGGYYIRPLHDTGDGIEFVILSDVEGGKTKAEYRKWSYEDLEANIRTGDTYVQVNDKVLGFETPPVAESDRTLVPMRFLFEQLGAEVNWDEGTQTATAAIAAEPAAQNPARAKSVSFAIDNTTATVNGAEAVMDVPARLVNDKTMVPLRFLSENLGYLVSWNEETNTAAVIDPAEFSADKTEHPELSETTQQHYVIYQEGYRNGRIELALFDIADGSTQSLVKRDKALELTDNSKYQNDSKWYWEEGKWIPFEEGYERISNNAVAVIASDLSVAE